MLLHVICPGCLKRFQVGIRFAGMKGTCPNCGATISIPKESVKMHSADETVSGKGKKRNLLVRPLSRIEMVVDSVHAGYYVSGILGVLLLAFIFGTLPMYDALRTIIGLLGLGLVAFPLTLFGYQTIRDRELMFAFTGKELYCRTGITAAGYVILWVSLERLLIAIKAEVSVSLFYFSMFAVLATLLAHSVLVMKMRDALLHYCVFGFSIVLLRFLIGFGWFWESGGLTRYGTAPPPPLLPGM